MFVSKTAVVVSGFSRRINQIDPIDNVHGALYNDYCYSVSLIRCNSPMENSIFTIENKNSLLDESIESTIVYGNPVTTTMAIFF